MQFFRMHHILITVNYYHLVEVLGLVGTGFHTDCPCTTIFYILQYNVRSVKYFFVISQLSFYINDSDSFIVNRIWFNAGYICIYLEICFCFVCIC